MRFGIQYDLRNPAISGRSFEQLYGEFLEQVEWADQHGFDFVSLPEHHFVDDGYLPSPFVVASAIAARTRHMRIVLNLVLLPMRHPVQVAEDAAIVDIISGGRLDLTVGAGYRQAEYDGLGISMRQRGGRMEEGVEIIKRCWTEDEFDFDGRYWKLRNVRVTPKPVQKPRPKITMGGASPASARRAARIADGYNPINPKFLAVYREELNQLGKPADFELPDPNGPCAPANLLHVSNDPAAAWKIIGPHALHVVNSYAEFAGGQRYSPYATAQDPDELLGKGTHAVLTPAETIALGKQLEAHDPANATLRFSPLVGGLPAQLGQECLELVVREVMPAFR
ncbi:MAG: LLM class flavin-dependent oxidoreductase [Hyphomicrobiales bacterium]